MIEKRIDKANDSATIVLSPDNSPSWRFNMQLTATLAILLLIISSYFALMGLWVIFLFAGLGIFVLIICKYIRLHANQSTETISIKGNAVTIIRRCYQKTESWKYHRVWANYWLDNLNFVVIQNGFYFALTVRSTRFIPE